MLFAPDRDQLRQFYCQTWQAHRQGAALEPLQEQIVAVIEQHPEYHALLADTERALGGEYLPEMGETNPFLHMGMHLAIREQLNTDRPAGIRELYQRMLLRVGDPHRLDHQLMDCLAEMLWRAQKNAAAPDESAYLDCIRALTGQP